MILLEISASERAQGHTLVNHLASFLYRFTFTRAQLSQKIIKRLVTLFSQWNCLLVRRRKPDFPIISH